jgi:DNA-binding SARP family transcriptional activator/streptogramin lyase
LLLNAGTVVSPDRLIEELWEDPPASAAHGIEAYVSRLRRTLQDAGGDGRLTRRGGGYVLDVDPKQNDVARFERLLEQARRADPKHASALLRDALALWRGRALADVELFGTARVEVERLEELRLTALEDRIDADLAAGQGASLAGELHALVAEHPLRDRLRAQQMRALYAAGRQVDALESYAEGRRALKDLGLEPSQQLNDLQRRILRHDASLGPMSAPPTRSRRRAWFAVVAAVAAAVLVALAIMLTRGPEAASHAVVAMHNSVGLLDPVTGRLVADIPIGGRLSSGLPQIAVGLGSVWVCDRDDGTLLRIDPNKHVIVRTIGLGTTPAAVAVGHGAVWVASESMTELIAVDSLGNVSRRLTLRGAQLPAAPFRGVASIASGPDSIWVGRGIAGVAKIDPRTGRMLHYTAGLGGVDPRALVATPDAVWVTGGSSAVAVRLDSLTGALDGRTPSAGTPVAFWVDVAAGAGGLWVTDSADDLVWRIDRVGGRASGSVPVDHGPEGIAVHGGSVWVANLLGGTIEQIDPATMHVESRAIVGGNPSDLAAGPRGLWITFA